MKVNVYGRADTAFRVADVEIKSGWQVLDVDKETYDLIRNKYGNKATVSPYTEEQEKTEKAEAKKKAAEEKKAAAPPEK